MKKITCVAIATLTIVAGCKQKETVQSPSQADSLVRIQPVFTSDLVKHDTDDPAIWINTADPSQTLILGTDKGGDTGDGALYVFDLQGKEVSGKTIKNLQRPNNVDIAYGLLLNGEKTDIAVLTERNTNSIRVFSVPEMKAIDQGGIPVFKGDSLRSPMGIALYTEAVTGNIYAIVGRKSGPVDGTYLWQYRLYDDGKGNVAGELVRKFGKYSGVKEIESIAVDNELGYVYCSDENIGVRKYYAHPDSSATELALFATSGFVDDHEGISIYKHEDGTGFILVSDQQGNRFHVFPREGVAGNPHEHTLLHTANTSTTESDGSEITSIPLPGFPRGLFVAMSDDKTFQLYHAEDLLPTTAVE